jgi:carbon monoxide dehydrogenase subunit G
MRLENEFVVPRPVDEAWAVLTDVERIAPCMPGAQLTEIVDDKYHGTVKVKVGPVTAQYAGVARFVEQDPVAHHVVLEAKGKERNGRGMASALVTADLTGEGDSTRVHVSTDLTISGPVAQFGRGAIAEISGKLLGQFVERLKATVLESEPAAQPPAPPSVSAPPPAPAPQPASPSVSASPPAAAPPSSAPAARESATPAPAGAAPRSAPAPAVEAPSVDLLRVAGVPILKRVLPLVLAVVVVIVVLVLWLG